MNSSSNGSNSTTSPHRRVRTALQIGGVLGVYLVAALISYTTSWSGNNHHATSPSVGLPATSV